VYKIIFDKNVLNPHNENMMMKEGTVSNEMIYEMLKQMQHRMDRIEHNAERFEDKMDKRFEKVDEQFAKIDEHFEKIDQQFAKIDEQFLEVRNDIAGLNKMKINWNGSLVTGIIATSSILTLLLIRLLSSIGIKIMV